MPHRFPRVFRVRFYWKCRADRAEGDRAPDAHRIFCLSHKCSDGAIANRKWWSRLSLNSFPSDIKQANQSECDSLMVQAERQGKGASARTRCLWSQSLTSVDFAKCIGRATRRRQRTRAQIHDLFAQTDWKIHSPATLSSSTRPFSLYQAVHRGKRHCTIKYSMVFDHLARKWLWGKKVLTSRRKINNAFLPPPEQLSFYNLLYSNTREVVPALQLH